MGRAGGAPARALLLVLLGAIVAGCDTQPVQVVASDPPATDAVFAPAPGPPDRAPSGTVRVAYPDEPDGYLDLRGDDPAAADLGALWGLPLYRLDPAGQLVAGLVERWTVADDEPFTVVLTLRPGEWSDGTPVRAEDVVATVQALRDGPRGAELTPLLAVTASGEHEVRLRFDRPYARWPYLLAGVGVLPEEVVAGGGTDAFASGLPVSGGWYRLAGRVPGHSFAFEAHPNGPLGPPGVARVDVLVVPRYETALGLLRDGEVDVALGYLALNPVERAARVEGTAAAAPLGGTWVGLSWRAEGPLGAVAAASRRRSIGAAIDVTELVEGLLGPSGEIATSPVPGVAGPWGTATDDVTAEVAEPTVVLPRWHEAVTFTGRALQRDLRVAGGGLELVAEAAPDVVTLARERFDGAVAVRRTGPRPSLTGVVRDRDAAFAADASVPGQPAFDAGLAAAASDALVWPLYRVGVAHVWRTEVSGLRPSGWPGLAFWDVGSWRVTPR